MLEMNLYKKTLLIFSDYILLTFILLIGLTGIIVQNGGLFVYALDDAYIHLAIGRNIALHGIWGVTAHEFTSASSSPLWALLLTGLYHLSGNLYIYTPLLINIISCYGILYIASAITRFIGVSVKVSQSIKIFMILCFPFLPLIAGGMENTLFALFVLMFVYALFIRTDKTLISVGILSTLMVATRYEGAFVIASATIVLSMKREWKNCFVIILGGILPILVFGIYFISQGGEFFPNSLLIKGNVNGGLYSVIRNAAYNTKYLIEHFSPLPFLCLLLCVTTYFLWRKHRLSVAFPLFLLTSITFTIHLLLAQMGWLYRYEIYLLAMSAMSVAVSIREIRTIYLEQMALLPRSAILFIALFVLVGCARRLEKGHRVSFQFSREIFLQQIQMANFVKKYFPNNNIALNDSGAVCYFTNIHCTDVYGLATTEIARAKRKRTYTPDMMEDICRKRNTEIAIVYPQWLRSGFMFGTNVKGDMPKQWKKVGALVLGYKDYVIGGDTVNFYAVKPSYYDTLRTALQNNKTSMSFGTTSRLILE